jgi:hypothetical protein
MKNSKAVLGSVLCLVVGSVLAFSALRPCEARATTAQESHTVALPAPVLTPSVLQMPTTVVVNKAAPKAKTAHRTTCVRVTEWRDLEQGTIDTQVLDTHCVGQAPTIAKTGALIVL